MAGSAAVSSYFDLSVEGISVVQSDSFDMTVEGPGTAAPVTLEVSGTVIMVYDDKIVIHSDLPVEHDPRTG